MLRVCNTLEETPEAEFDLVIGNPPYGRVTLDVAQRAKYARSLYGHANLYGVFTDIALRWSKPNGLIAYLTPTSMLGGHYFAALRGLLAKEAPPIGIDFVEARKDVFEDVLQETFLALYRRGGEVQPIQVHYLQVANETEAKLVRNGVVGLPTDPKLPWLAPRDPRHSALIAHVASMPSRLADWGYEISTGPLVWNRHKPQLVHRPGKDCHPLVWAESVSSEGCFAFRAEKRNHAPYFKMQAGDDWLLVRKGCVLLQRTTAKEQARRLIAAELPEVFVTQHGGVVVENHLNMIRPKESPKVSAGAVAAILNSRIVDEVFRCISGSVAVSAFELGALPMPSAEAMGDIEEMLTKGASKTKLETAISALYGQEPA
jgi:adenine-specific DNA-methyltransferase